MRPLILKRVKSLFFIFLFTLSLCLALLVTVPYCGRAAQADTSQLVESAKKEGKFLLYSTLSVQEGNLMLKKFSEKYPFIKAEMYRSSSKYLLPRIIAEDQSKKYLCDVVAIPALLVDVLKKKQLLIKYLSPHGKFIPEEFKDPDGYWVAAYHMLNVVAYNTKLVAPKDVPRKYEDLLDPKWRGKITMDTGGVYWFAGILKIMGEEKGLEYMKRLSGQNIKFRSGKPVNIQMVAASEQSIALAVLNHTVDRVKVEGGPIDWTAFEPVIADINPPAISAHAPHPYAARLFVDFMLSREGQEIIASINKLPTRNDIDSPLPRVKGRLKILPYDPSFTDNYEKYSTLFRNVLMKQ